MDPTGLHGILNNLYEEMIPLSEDLITSARAMGGLGALFYISYRVWRNLANAEPVDLFPLLRPFVIGFCIMVFPQIVETVNAIMKPVLQATEKMQQGQNHQIFEYRKQKDTLEKERYARDNPDKAYVVDDETFEKALKDTKFPLSKIRMYTEKAKYDLKMTIRDWFRNLLEILYQAVALVIDTIRVFFLIVLAIIGPIAFALAVYDGFQQSISNWIARYINVYLWLPVANIFGAIIAKINVLMLQKDIADIQTGGSVGLDDVAYLIFLIIGIIGYTCVPTVAGWIVQSCGGGSYTSKLTSMGKSAMVYGGAAAGAAAGAALGAMRIAGGAAGRGIGKAADYIGKKVDDYFDKSTDNEAKKPKNNSPSRHLLSSDDNQKKNENKSSNMPQKQSKSSQNRHKSSKKSNKKKNSRKKR